MSTIPKEEFKNKVMDIMTDHIHFSPQVQAYLVHGAIDKIWELHQLATDGREELEKENAELKNVRNVQSEVMVQNNQLYQDAANQITALQSSLKEKENRLNNQEQTISEFQDGLIELFGLEKNTCSFFSNFKEQYLKHPQSEQLKEKEKECEELKTEIKYWGENQLEWRRNSDGKAQLLRQQSKQIEELKAENERLNRLIPKEPKKLE